MNTIFAKALYELEKNNDLVLVTIVDDAGSAPRGSGSQMLVGANGRIVGTIGGGAVEYNSEKTAKEFLLNKKSGLHQYRLRKNEAEDIGMVCGGDVDVWFQYISASDKVWTEIAAGIVNEVASHHSGWFIQSLKDGKPALVSETGEVLAGTAPDTDEDLYINGSVKKDGYFSMPLPVGERALVFGGGHIAQALVPILRSVGFRPVVMDAREAYSRPELFPDAEQVICGDFDRIDDYIEVQPGDYAVVMTNGHSHDYEVQLQLLKKDSIAYIGVVGSAKKTEAVNARLHAQGISEEKTTEIHTPIGTKIKAVTPEEIAVSIAGEMILVRAVQREEKFGKTDFGCPMH